MSSIEKRGKDSYRLTVITGYHENGIPFRERKTVKAKNKTETGKLLVKFEAEILSGNYIKVESTTLNHFYNDWLEKHTKSTLTPDTLRS